MFLLSKWNSDELLPRGIAHRSPTPDAPSTSHPKARENHHPLRRLRDCIEFVRINRPARLVDVRRGYGHPETQPERSAYIKQVEGYMHDHYFRLNGFVVFDQINRYQIDFRTKAGILLVNNLTICLIDGEDRNSEGG